MSPDDKARLLALVSLPVASLSLVDVGFLVRVVNDHPDDVADLVPDLAALLEL